MKNFDLERQEAAKDRAIDFTVGGETFHVQPFVPPEMLLHFDDWTAADTRTTIEGFDAFITGVIEPSEKKLWAKVRKEAKPAINLNDLEAVAFWLLGQVSGRPTTPPSPSQPGRGRQEATSPAG